jgi:amino acid adenylation domain-containing protein
MKSFMKLCIHDVFRQHVVATPDRTALVDRNRCFSFAELDNLSDNLAAMIGSHGCRQGEVVALMMDRSVEMIVAMLGVLKYGAAYMPLDKADPVFRNRRCLDRAKTRLILVDSDCQELCDSNRTIYHVNISCLGGVKVARPTPNFTCESPAYVMFTSGTTAGPKGVIIPHRAVTRLVLNTNYIEITPGDAVLQLSTPTFDASTFEIWGALLNGATLVLYSGTVLDPNLLSRHIVDDKITILWLTAAVFHIFVNKYLDALRSLRVLLAGGDVLYREAVVRVIDEIDGITVINGYGPTENTTFTCCYVMTKANRPSDNVPIGRPISGTQVFILDDQGREVSPGNVGELYAAGTGVGLGYLDDNSNENSFLYNADLSRDLLYRTGDLVRVNDQGVIEFIGRRDAQVKIRGYRFSLEEVKACLIEVPTVLEAVVGCQKSFTGDQLLIAYVQSKRDVVLSAETVKTYLKRRLPSYMIPDKIVIRTDLPLTRNGKIANKILFSSFT